MKDHLGYSVELQLSRGRGNWIDPLSGFLTAPSLTWIFKFSYWCRLGWTPVLVGIALVELFFEIGASYLGDRKCFLVGKFLIGLMNMISFNK